MLRGELDDVALAPRASAQAKKRLAQEAVIASVAAVHKPSDVESASNFADDEAPEPLEIQPAETPPTPLSSGSAEPSLADPESASQTDIETQSENLDPLDLDEQARAATEKILAQRWQCDLCYDLHSQLETPWQLGEERCNHTFCRRCVLGSIRWGGRCPYDNTTIPPIIVCGAMGTFEYIYHEKHEEARRTSGIMCGSADCPGVAPALDVRPPQPTACASCNMRLCGRKVCGAPWTDSHRCWDIVEEQRLRAEQDLETQLQHRTLDPHVVNTRRRLAKQPRFRPCPCCSGMVEHIGGCNMVYHESCRTRWCFICRRVGTCVDFDCRSPGSGASTPRGPPTPRSSLGPTATPSVPTKPRRVLTIVIGLLTMACIFLSWALSGNLGLHMGVPRSGFLGGVTLPLVGTLPEGASCNSEACADAQEPTTSLPFVEKLDV